MHVEDDGELEFFVNDGGQTVWICKKCHRQWVGTVAAGPPAAGDAVPAPPQPMAPPPADIIAQVSERRPDLFA